MWTTKHVPLKHFTIIKIYFWRILSVETTLLDNFKAWSFLFYFAFISIFYITWLSILSLLFFGGFLSYTLFKNFLAIYIKYFILRSVESLWCALYSIFLLFYSIIIVHEIIIIFMLIEFYARFYLYLSCVNLICNYYARFYIYLLSQFDMYSK